MEIWKPLARMPRYEISNIGNVRSLKNNSTKFLKQANSNSGYKLVCLFGNGKKHTSYVHRLVAEVFIPTDHININIGVVNHKDRNKTNNCVENLEWVSVMENVFHWKDNKRYNITQEISKICGDATYTQLNEILEFCNKYRQ